MGGNPLDYLGVQSSSVNVEGKVQLATVTECTTGTNQTKACTPEGVAAVALASAPDASESVKGVLKLSTTAQAQAGTDDATAITPLKFVNGLKAPGAIGGTTAAAGSFTGLTADGTGTVTLTSNAASVYDVTGAGNDLTLSSDAGRILLDSGEDAADSIYIRANAGTSETIRLHADQGTGAASIHLEADAGGITLESGLASEDGINLVATGGGIDMDAALSVVITCTENAADAIQLTASAGGIDIAATGAAGEDIDIVNTGGSVRISATESVENAINIESTAGGVNILASGAAAGEDIDIVATGSSVNISSTENVADAIYLRANAGTSETVRIHSDQGTGAASVELVSDVGGVTLTSGLASEDAINLSATAGGVDIDGALSVVIASSENAADSVQIRSSAGGIDILASGAAAGEDIDIIATGSSVNITATESDAAAIKLDATLGGIDILASGAGAGEDIDIIATGSSVNITATESDGAAIKLDATLGGIDIFASGAAAGEDIDITATGSSVNITATESDAAAIKLDATLGGIDILASGAAAGEDIDVIATGSSVNITSTEAVAAAINLTASTGAGGITMTSGTGNITMSGTVNQLDAKYVIPTGFDHAFDGNPVMQTAATTGGAATGATGDVNLMAFPEFTMEQFILGAGQTIISPRMGTGGLNIALDQVDNEGAEYNFGGARLNSPHAFTANTSAAFLIEASFNIVDISGCEPLCVGFRKVEANNSALASYTDYYGIGMNAATSATNATIFSRLNSGGAALGDSGSAFSEGSSQTVSILVSSAGVITATIGGSAPSTPVVMTFDSGDVVVPFIHFLNGADVAGNVELVDLKIGFQ